MQFQQSLRALDAGPAIGTFRQTLQDVAKLEFNRRRAQLGPLTAEQEHAIESLLLATVNKISHPVLGQLRRSYDPADADRIEAWRELFGLED
jgi:glutamyl-tRNA reductase